MFTALVVIPSAYLHFWNVPHLLERRGTEERLARTLDLDGLRTWAESLPRVDEDSESEVLKKWSTKRGVLRPEGYSTLAYVVSISNTKVPQDVLELLGPSLIVERISDPSYGRFVCIRRDRIALWIGDFDSKMPFESHWPFRLRLASGIYFHRTVNG